MNKAFKLVAPLLEKFSSKQGNYHRYIANRVVLKRKDGNEYTLHTASLDF
jgi:hypothetical protein